MTPIKAVPPPPEYPPMPPTYTYPTTATMISEMNAYGRLEEGWHGNNDNFSHDDHEDGEDRASCLTSEKDLRRTREGSEKDLGRI